MTRLSWGSDTPSYEYGVDRVVVYPNVWDEGFAWNGVTSIAESSVGGDYSSREFDGIRVGGRFQSTDFQATLTAFDAPDAFNACVGMVDVIPGFTLTNQRRITFGLSYRTMCETGYKLHIVYNATASLSDLEYHTTSDSPVPTKYSWIIDTTPVPINDHNASAHFIVDSTRMNSDALAFVESRLYGTETGPAHILAWDDLITVVTNWAPLLIGTESAGLSELHSGLGDLNELAIDGIFARLNNTARLTESSLEGLYTL